LSIHLKPKLFRCTLYDERDPNVPLIEKKVVDVNQTSILKKLHVRYFPRSTQHWDIEFIRNIHREEWGLKGEFSDFTAICEAE